MIINFEKFRNHSPEQSNNIVCLKSFIYKKQEDVYRQRLYDMGFDFLVDINLFDSDGNIYTVAKIQF
jgi:hypothetical protein